MTTTDARRFCRALWIWAALMYSVPALILLAAMGVIA